MASLLQMRDIEKYYGDVKAPDGAFLEVERGEVHALLGANGAGKSTLMKVLRGELPYSGGTIHFNGRELKPGSRWRRRSSSPAFGTTGRTSTPFIEKRLKSTRFEESNRVLLRFVGTMWASSPTMGNAGGGRETRGVEAPPPTVKPCGACRRRRRGSE